MQPVDVVKWIWIVFVSIWALAAFFFTPKRTIRRQSVPILLLQSAVVVAVVFLPTLLFPSQFHSLSEKHFLAPQSSLHGIGILLTLAGCAFALWARAVLGRNWSGTVTVKEDHELITHGPYAWVRHPIYSGLLLALLGTALVVGKLIYLSLIPICLLALVYKFIAEEKFMLETFGNRYRSYRLRVKALIPYIV